MDLQLAQIQSDEWINECLVYCCVARGRDCCAIAMETMAEAGDDGWLWLKLRS